MAMQYRAGGHFLSSLFSLLSSLFSLLSSLFSLLSSLFPLLSSLSPLLPRCHGSKQCSWPSMASCTDRSGGREAGTRKKSTALERRKTSGTDIKLTQTHYINPFLLTRNDLVYGHYAIPVLLLFVARCTHQTVRQGHQQPIRGAKSGWRRNARALRGDGQN